MTRFAPQENDFKIVQRISIIQNWIFVVVLFLSISTLIEYLSPYLKDYSSGLQFALLILVIFYFLLGLVNSIYFRVRAESTRREALIQNSFGVSFGTKKAQGYYDTDDMKPGIKKLAANLYENAYFSYHVSLRMLPLVIVLNLLFGIVLLYVGYQGFKESKIVLPLFQAFLSVHLFGKLALLITFVVRVKGICNYLNQLFYNGNQDKIVPSVINTLLKYEAIISQTQITLSERIFKRRNERIKAGWMELRDSLDIKD